MTKNEPIRLKQFVFEQADQWKVTPTTIYCRISNGRYPGIRIIWRLNQGLLVTNRPEYKPTPRPVTKPKPPKPLVNKRHPELRGLSQKEYQRRYMQMWRKTPELKG